jgi:hypothetical protein
MWDEFLLHYFLTGLMLGGIALVDGMEHGNERSKAARAARKLFAVWCFGTLVVQQNLFQLMSAHFGLEIADDVVLVALLVVTLRKLWPFGLSKKEKSHVEMDA